MSKNAFSGSTKTARMNGTLDTNALSHSINYIQSSTTIIPPKILPNRRSAKDIGKVQSSRMFSGSMNG